MKNAQAFKKDLSKVIKRIREFYYPGKYNQDKFPKAMMGSRQIMNKTATINCGGEWRKPEASKAIAETVMADREFCAICAYDGVKAELEYNRASDAYQVRLTW